MDNNDRIMKGKGITVGKWKLGTKNTISTNQFQTLGAAFVKKMEFVFTPFKFPNQPLKPHQTPAKAIV